ncbi:TPA: hypothetical protein ACH3X2_002344 [Trebouxia sp. C0005]
MGRRLADKLWRLRRDYERLELPSQLGVSYDLLKAANPDGLDELRAGKTISLGAIWQVEVSETVFTVAQELSAIANKMIHPYDVIQYNVEVNPAHLRPGTNLVVPLAHVKLE